MKSPRLASLSAIALTVILLPRLGEAEPMRVNGITFSDERGGFEITGVSGSGSREDPFVVHETINTISDEVILVIRDIDPSFGNPVGTHHAFAFVLTKVVTNRTPRSWTRFALELRETPDTYSPYGDGLSFGQASTAGRPFKSDGFLSSSEIEEPYDQLEFTSGRIGPRGTVAMTFVVSDASPESIFYLLQQPGQVVAQLPALSIAARPDGLPAKLISPSP